MRILHAPLFLLTLFAALSTTAAEPTLSEAKVFEWWDDGIIDGDEAGEILDLLEEGNTTEACLLAEVYALESCSQEEGYAERGSKKAARKKTGREKAATRKAPELTPHGFAEWKGRTDSTGHLESSRMELRLHFYRYTLRLGSQSLLSYRNGESEAHFGEFSTKELHSVIPTDTLWGTALRYPLGCFYVGALLDTMMDSRVTAGFVPRRGTDMEVSYWHSNGAPAEDSAGVRRQGEHSVVLQAKSGWGHLAAWWAGEDPLLKIQLRFREKGDYATTAWKADAYLHGDSLPRHSHLSKNIAKNRFWGSQTASLTFPGFWNSKATLNGRLMMPLEGDSVKARFKAAAETGPEKWRGGVSATCLEAASGRSRCRQNDLAFKVTSRWNVAVTGDQNGTEALEWSGTLRVRHTRGQGFGAPLVEGHAAYEVNAFSETGVAVIFPKGNPARELRLRSETDIGTDFLQLSLAVTFRRTAETPLHPQHAAMKIRVTF